MKKWIDMNKSYINANILNYLQLIYQLLVNVFFNNFLLLLINCILKFVFDL